MDPVRQVIIGQAWRPAEQHLADGNGNDHPSRRDGGLTVSAREKINKIERGPSDEEEHDHDCPEVGHLPALRQAHPGMGAPDLPDHRTG
jgi:hypothetical protein